MYLLDTSVVSELRRSRPNPNVVAWLGGILEPQLRLSAVTLGEIRRGIENLRERDPTKASEIERWADKLEASWAALPVDSASYRLHARLMRRKPVPAYEDALIAAVAIRPRPHGRHTERSDFAAFDAPILNPFESPSAP